MRRLPIASLLVLAGLCAQACVPPEHEPGHDHIGPAELAEQTAYMQVRSMLRMLPDPADLRPEARLFLEAMRRGDLDKMMPDLSTQIFSGPPTKIKIWRRSLGGTHSCNGPYYNLSMEDYVKGVLPHEWYTSWNKESLRAGAVAIRSYASSWVLRGGKYTCADLCDTTASQVYKPSTKTVTNQAVDHTKHQVMLKSGTIPSTEYSAENSTYPTWNGVKVDDTATCAGKTKYGHGRGMCQWGSQRWALKGKSYAWIVAHYYPGATLWKPTTPKPDSAPWPKPDSKPWPKPDSKPWPKPDSRPWPQKDSGAPAKKDNGGKPPINKDGRLPGGDLPTAAASLAYNTLNGGCAVAGESRGLPPGLWALLLLVALGRRKKS